MYIYLEADWGRQAGSQLPVRARPGLPGAHQRVRNEVRHELRRDGVHVFR